MRRQKGPNGEDRFCTKPKGWGTDHPGIGHCKWHAGSTPNANASATRERVQQITESVRQQLGGFYGLGAPEAQVNPVEVLAEELARCRAVVAWIEGMIGQWSYDESEDTGMGGTYGRLPEVRLTGLPPLLTVVHGEKSSTVSDSEYRAWLRQLGEERDRLRITAKLCIDAGLDERLTRVAEGGGLMLVQALALVLAGMGLAHRQAELDVLVPRALETVHQRMRVGA
jgi:hypothetical protein